MEEESMERRHCPSSIDRMEQKRINHICHTRDKYDPGPISVTTYLTTPYKNTDLVLVSELHTPYIVYLWEGTAFSQRRQKKNVLKESDFLL